ncbi:DASH family cryptochrome, partial [Plectosphaerella plurivora]
MGATNILIYLLRHDLRVSDNPIFHHLASVKDQGFTHLVPVYVFPAQQIEVSGFIRDGSKSPYPEARSQLGNYWRCGPHRAKFLAQSVWNLKKSLQTLGNDLCIRAGNFEDTLESLLKGFAEKKQKVGAVWMVGEEAVEEKRDERDIARLCSEHGVDWKLWQDEKYFVDDQDNNLKDPQDLPDVFTTYRKTQEPLRERPRPTLPAPAKSSLPPYPDESSVPAQSKPFEVPNSYDELESSLMEPIREVLEDPVAFPEGASSVHPLDGGEDEAQGRLAHLIRSGAMSSYKETRNGLLGVDFSTKLSAYLALGCLTARQIHEEMAGYEDGKMDKFKDVTGYGAGENDGTRAVRFELLWRDYMRLCTRKFGPKLFRDSGFREEYKGKWKTANPGVQDEVATVLQRFMAGTTGMGLIDASQRELYHTGYTSNRARQNVASFLTKHLGIDWRYGAEWYECLLVDYDVSSNWSNWQYVAGVGNDPRGEARIFNPVKQAFDYDKDGEYVRAWVPEVRPLEKLENVFQAWTASKADLDRHQLTNNVMVTHPIKKIEFSVEGKPKASRRPYMRRRGRGGNG